MNKQILLTVFILALNGSVLAAPVASVVQQDSLRKGRQTLEIDALVDFVTPLGTDFSMTLGYGRLMLNNLEVGGNLEYSDNDALTSWSLGGYGQYYFSTINPSFAPFLGGGLSFANTDFDYRGNNDDETAVVLSGNAGALFFITPQLAFDGHFNLRLATEDIYLDENDRSSTDSRLIFGLKYFF